MAFSRARTRVVRCEPLSESESEAEPESAPEAEPEPISARLRFRARIAKKARLEFNVRERKIPATGQIEKRAAARSPPTPGLKYSSDEEDEELVEPEDLIERTKQRYERAKQNLKEAKGAHRCHEADGWSCGRRCELQDMRHVNAWYERRKREYKDAKSGKDTTDYIAYLREKLEGRHGPLKRREAGFREWGNQMEPGENVVETAARRLMQRGYDPLIPAMPMRPYLPIEQVPKWAGGLKE